MPCASRAWQFLRKGDGVRSLLVRSYLPSGLKTNPSLPIIYVEN